MATAATVNTVSQITLGSQNWKAGVYIWITMNEYFPLFSQPSRFDWF